MPNWGRGRSLDFLALVDVSETTSGISKLLSIFPLLNPLTLVQKRNKSPHSYTIQIRLYVQHCSQQKDTLKHIDYKAIIATAPPELVSSVPKLVLQAEAFQGQDFL